MATRTNRKAGFTLVEILIVVVILGILAAIVIPQFTNASQNAKGSSLYTQLQTIRSQLELYQVQHNGNYPTLAQLWGNMTGKTDVAGTILATTDAGYADGYGPYLQQDPSNPFTNSTAVAVTTETASPSAATDAGGWHYNVTTGQIWAAKFSESTGQEITAVVE